MEAAGGRIRKPRETEQNDFLYPKLKGLIGRTVNRGKLNVKEMFIITIDHKRWRQWSKRHNTVDRRYPCLLGAEYVWSDFQRLVRSRVNTADRLAFAGGHPLPTGLETTDSRATGLAHDCGAFSDTVLDT